MELLQDTADYFSLGDRQACTIIREVAEVMHTWQVVATEVGARRGVITRMASAFEHEGLQAVLKLQGLKEVIFYEDISEHGITVQH